jgi:restriction system protein
MKSYYRIMAGSRSSEAESFFKNSYIAIGYGINQDLTHKLPEKWQDFNREFRPVYLESHPHKSKIAAGLACGFVHTVSKGIQIGDIIFCPDGQGTYYIGEVVSDYYYEAESDHPHRRKMKWYDLTVERSQLSVELQASTRSSGAVVNITQYSEEIEKILSGHKPPAIIANDETIEDPAVFALEKHLEEFLVHNWTSTELGTNYEIYNDGEFNGQQYQTDTGNIDILAISKDKKELLVVELKRGHASDVVVGQIQRYMGYVIEELAEPDQSVRGIIIALEDDLKLRRALKVTQNIEFYRYQVSFSLIHESV